jgi:hypothetical protein
MVIPLTMFELRPWMKAAVALLVLSSAALAQTTAPESPPPPPPEQIQQPAPAPQSQAGQWVHTDQYGWVWMPDGEQYVYAPPSAQPQMYVYYPSFGWRWVMAPWLLQVGPSPYVVYGPRHYAWHPRYYRAYPVYRVAPHRYWHRRW